MDASKGGWKSEDGKWAGGWDAAKGWGVKSPYGNLGGPLMELSRNPKDYRLMDLSAKDYRLMDLSRYAD